MLKIRYILLTILVFSGALSAAAQEKMAVLSGRVIDSADGSPIVGAVVLTQDSRYVTGASATFKTEQLKSVGSVKVTNVAPFRLENCEMILLEEKVSITLMQ